MTELKNLLSALFHLPLGRSDAVAAGWGRSNSWSIITQNDHQRPPPDSPKEPLFVCLVATFSFTKFFAFQSAPRFDRSRRLEIARRAGWDL